MVSYQTSKSLEPVAVPCMRLYKSIWPCLLKLCVNGSGVCVFVYACVYGLFMWLWMVLLLQGGSKTKQEYFLIARNGCKHR